MSDQVEVCNWPNLGKSSPSALLENLCPGISTVSASLKNKSHN